MISANCFVPIGCNAIVEGACCQVQHAIIERWVLKNCFVCWRFSKGLLVLSGWCKHCIVEVAFVHLPHIYECYQNYGNNHPRGFHFVLEVQPQHECSRQNECRTAPSIGSEHSNAHLFQVGHDGLNMFGRERLQCLHFTYGDEGREEQTREKREEQCYTCCETHTVEEWTHVVSQYLWALHHLFNGQGC